MDLDNNPFLELPDIGELDIVFVIDTTGSMESCIAIVKKEVVHIIEKIQKLSSCKSVQYGLIEYRDHDFSEYVVKTVVSLTPSVEELLSGVNSITTVGGQDVAEAVTDGLFQLVRMHWRPNSVKTAILIGDAPPHGTGVSTDNYPGGCPCEESWLEQSESCREIGITVHTVSCSAQADESFKKIASTTFGQFMSLKDTNKLPAIITGVAESDLDKLKLAKYIQPVIKKNIQLLLAVNSQEDRIRILQNLLSKEENLKVLSLGNEGNEFQVEQTEITCDDVTQAVTALNKIGYSHSLTLLFPKFGLVSSKLPEKGGLFKDGDPNSLVPLLSVEVKVNIVNGCAECEISQTYKNKFDHPIEAEYHFPLEESAAVTNFVAEIGGKRILGKCMEQQQAEQTYSDAIAEGKGAFLLEKKIEGVFSVSVGNLEPEQEAKIRITFIQMLERSEGWSCFNLPAAAVPRYAPQEIASVEKQHDNQLPVSIILDIETSSPIEEHSSNHSYSFQWVDNSDNKKKQIVVLEHLRQDFWFHYKLVEDETRSVEIEEWQSYHPTERNLVAKITFNPTLRSEKLHADGPTDVILLLDCSASVMSKSRKELLHLASSFINLVRNMEDVFWNIGIFGSHFEFAFFKNQNGEQSVEAANEFLFKLQGPHLGGTELEKVLKEIPSLIKSTEASTHVILVTDGEIGNSDSAKKFLDSQVFQVFPMGTSRAVRTSVRRWASSTVAPAGELSTMENQFQRIFSSMKEVCVKSGRCTVTPTALPPIIHNSPLVVFAFMNEMETKRLIVTDIITLSGKFHGEPKEISVDITIHDQEYITSFTGGRRFKIKKGTILHGLAAKSLLKELERNDDKEKAVPLAIKYNLASKFTSFVAIEERQEAVEQTVQFVQVNKMLKKPTTDQPPEQTSTTTSSSTSTNASSSSSSGGGNFWNVFGSFSVSTIDTLLDGDYELEKYLEEDEIIQEVKAQNQRLLDHLTTPENMKLLVDHITKDWQESDYPACYKYSYVSCEILCSEVYIIYESLCDTPGLLDQLFSFYDKDPPINFVLSGFVCKTISMLLNFKAEEMMKYMKQQGSPLIAMLLKHLENSTAIELLTNILACRDSSNNSTHEWLSSTKLIPLLVEKMGETASIQTVESASQILSDIVSTWRSMINSPLIEQLQNEATINKIFNQMMPKGLSIQLLAGLSVLNEILKRLAKYKSQIEDFPALIRICIANIKPLKALLEVQTTNDNDNNFKTESSLGKYEAVTFERLKIVEFFSCLFALGVKEVNAEMVKQAVLAVLLNLFFSHPWNNFLHSTVMEVIEGILESDNEEMKIHVLTDSGLLFQIIQASIENEHECSQAKGVRRGYMGHITLISQSIIKSAEKSIAIHNILSENQMWKSYVKDILDPMVDKDDRDVGAFKASGISLSLTSSMSNAAIPQTE